MTKRERKYHYSMIGMCFINPDTGFYERKITRASNRKMNKAMKHFFNHFSFCPTGEIYKPVPATDKWEQPLYGLLPTMKTMNPCAGESVTITLTKEDHL